MVGAVGDEAWVRAAVDVVARHGDERTGRVVRDRVPCQIEIGARDSHREPVHRQRRRRVRRWRRWGRALVLELEVGELRVVGRAPGAADRDVQPAVLHGQLVAGDGDELPRGGGLIVDQELTLDFDALLPADFGSAGCEADAIDAVGDVV